MINKRIFFIFLIFSILWLVVNPPFVWAQECEVSESAIVTLKEPDFTTPKKWEVTYGEDGLEQFVGISLPLSSTGTLDLLEKLKVAAGGNYTPDSSSSILNPFIVKLDKKGKSLWEKKTKRSTSQTVENFLRAKNSYVLFGNISKGEERKGIYIARYNANGGKISERAIFSDKGALLAKGIVETNAKDGFIIAVERRSTKDIDVRKVVLYKVLKDGTIAWEKIYDPGAEAVVNSIAGDGDQGYILAGAIRGDEGRTAAWLIHLRENGALNWQRQYRRGKGARFEKVAVNPYGQVIIVGNIDPHGTTSHKSSWVMVTDKLGNLVWQRYYQGNYKILAQDFVAHDDGRIFVLADFYPVKASMKQKLQEARPRGHVRILTISPRGVLMDVQSYSAGLHAHASSIIQDVEGGFFVGGSVQQNIPDDLDKKRSSSSVFDGWIFQTGAVDDYGDPCSPDLEF